MFVFESSYINKNLGLQINSNLKMNNFFLLTIIFSKTCNPVFIYPYAKIEYFRE